MPRHVGIIMDGNRRFARTVGLELTSGHNYGAHKACEFLRWCLELGIDHVTLWGFSTENRSRNPEEVKHLYSLFTQQANELIEAPDLHQHKVRVKVIGDIEAFPEETKAALRRVEEVTAEYGAMQLNIALGYGGREEITHAVKTMLECKAKDGAPLEAIIESINTDEISRHLYTAGTPDPDFVIRTSGEVRLSGFLLWQTAYSEFYFCDAFWPGFRKVDFLRALRSYQARERRFGR